MNRLSIFYRITVAALALLALCACVQQPDGSAVDSQASSEMAPIESAAQPNLKYTTAELTPDGLSVERGTAYYLPLGEGKYIPAFDQDWKEYLDGEQFEVLESFSMPFVAVDKGDTALVYVLENPYRASVRFSCEPDLTLKLIGEETTLVPTEANTVRIYTTENGAAAVASVYKSYLAETRNILTLADKARQNPNLAKLYGAPHIYLWGDFALSEEDVKWQALIQSAGSPVLAHAGKVIASTAEDDGQFPEVLAKIAGQDYVDKYQRSVLLRGISTALRQEEFYDAAVFPRSNAAIKELTAKSQLNAAELLELNKQALYENLPGVLSPVEEWYAYDSSDIITEMKAAGIENAWIGLNSWEQGYQPQLVDTAVESGYLVGPYDSYHSIHEPGKEQWSTAAFPDDSLYEDATVMNKTGEKISGFQNVGRKLNPTLAMPSVKRRVEEILSTGVQFNSWFVDCDATGEVYDDYSPAHPTTKQEDVADFVRQAALAPAQPRDMKISQRISFAAAQVGGTAGKVWPYVLVGVGLGAVIHNYIPAHWIESLLGGKNPLAVPLATLVGVPMYADIFGTIPVAQALLEKGAALGTILSFMMAVTALSLPSLIMLRRVVSRRLLLIFTGVVTVGILLIGLCFNVLAPIW